MNEGMNNLLEMSTRAKTRHITLFSRFLNLAEQREGEIAARKAGADYALYGGADGCERKMLGVSDDAAPESYAFPIACLLVSPRSARFASPIAHRDVLGSLMGLGIERELIGDIIVREEGAYIFCTDKMAAYISGALTKIGSTDVNCELSAPPEGPLRVTQDVRIQVSSPRLDAVVAHLYHLSRGDAQTLFRQGRIMVDDSVCERPDYILKDGQVLSVRGHGRSLCKGVQGQSKKGKDILVMALYC